MYVRVCVCASVCACIYVRVIGSVSMRVCVCVHPCARLRVPVPVRVSMCVCAYMNVECLRVIVKANTRDTHTHTNTHTHTYTHTHKTLNGQIIEINTLKLEFFFAINLEDFESFV